MDIKKSRLLLNKINRLFEGIIDDDYVSPIEKDLMKSYIRDFYETFIDGNQQVVEPPKEQYSAPKSPESKPEPPKPKLTAAETKPVQPYPKQPIEFEIEEPKPEPPKPKYVPPVAKVEVPKPEPVQPKPVQPRYEPVQPKYEAPKVTPPTPVVEPPKPKAPIHQEPIDFDEFDVLFEVQQVKDLSERLSQGKKVSNLRSTMGLNERFLMQNELFHGNNSKFNDAIETLNGFDNFAQAKAYIIKELAPKNDWLDDKRLKRAKSFITKIKRLYK